MPIKEMPQYKSVDYKPLEIPQAGIGGLNLKDLEYEQQLNQSPYMMNMMYRNGSFSKRYGQKTFNTYDNEVYAIEKAYDDIFVHCGSDMLINNEVVFSGLPETKGVFCKFYHTLYYLVGTKYYQCLKEKIGDEYEYQFKEVEPYVPTVFNGADPQKEAKDAEEGESGFPGYDQDKLNLLSDKAIELYNADGESFVYYIKGIYEYYDWTIRPTITIDDEPVTDFDMNEEEGTITFKGETAPPEGYDNVSITWTLKESALKQDGDRLKNSKYSISYGNANNTRLFLGGGGNSKYFYSSPYDATYFPEQNWEIIGRTEDDITGFGLQYNTLFIFKPTEVYSVSTFTNSQYNYATDKSDTVSYFASQLVNSEKGCDAPYSIQLIDNKLTWYSSRYGICTLVSSNILDERNVRVISRNIERTNSYGIKGLLDYKEDLNTIISADYDNKYFLCFPESGMCYAWDYQISPYYYTPSKETDVKILDFFLFDNFHAKQFLNIKGVNGSGVDLIYINLNVNEIDILNMSFVDDINGEESGINAFYMTPFMQFGAVEYLKNVRDIFVQCRGDTASVIKMYYYTEQSSGGNDDIEEIRIGGKIWKGFRWDTFQWTTFNHAKAFRRRVSLKKIEMCSFLFKNDEPNRDMSISHLSIFYQVVKPVR